jgi:hypothetical protein
MSLPAVVAIAGAVIAGAFATQLGLQYRSRRRDHALAWAVALGLYAVGMVALAAGFSLGWTAGLFGLYWLAGALLNVPLLGVGQLHLLDPARAALWWTLGGLAVLWAVASVLMTPVDPGALASADARGGIPLGADAYDDGLAWGVLRPLTVGGSLVVLVGSVWSGIRARRPGVLLIALGVAISASSSTFVRGGRDALVAVVLTVGVSVMYAGFRSASRPAPRPSSTSTASA